MNKIEKFGLYVVILAAAQYAQLGKADIFLLAILGVGFALFYFGRGNEKK